MASDFNIANLMCWGKEVYITASGLHELHLVKNLMPSRAFPVRKSVRTTRK
jgi:hypothetical protein